MLSLVNTTKIIKRLIERKYGANSKYEVSKEEFQSFINAINAGIVEATKHPYFIAAVEQRYAKYSSKEMYSDSAVYVSKYDVIAMDIIYSACVEEIKKDAKLAHYVDHSINIESEYSKFTTEYPDCKC